MLAAVRASFKPEFLNRLDEIVLFDALTQDELARIVDLQLALLEKRLAVRRITIEVTDAARQWLAETGYDPAYGARPLRRLIQIGDRRPALADADRRRGHRRWRGRGRPRRGRAGPPGRLSFERAVRLEP